MRVLFLISGRTVPSSRFRVLQFVPRLRAAGHACVVAPCWPEKYEQPFGYRLSRWLRVMRRRLDLLRARRAPFDVIFLERELFDAPTWDMESAFRQFTRRLVLDVDDGIFLRYPEKFDRLVRLADLLIAGNASLAARGASAGGTVTVIPTCVDVDYFTPKGDDALPPAVPVIGWTGTSSNLPALAMLAPVLQELGRQCAFRFLVICDRSPRALGYRFEGVDLEYRPWTLPREVQDLHGMDIGVMPLEDNEWSRYKCGFKAIQYGAAGLPAVVSPVGVNREIVVEGVTGLFAASPDEWLRHLATLIQDPELRRQLGAAGRARICDRYSVQKLWPAWQHAVLGVEPIPGEPVE